MMNQHSESEHVSQPEPIDTDKIQEALEKRADQETAILPRLSVPDMTAKEENTPTGDFSSDQMEPEERFQNSGKPKRKRRHTSAALSERWWTPSVRSWFFTFMCMNMPIIGWFYLFHEAKHGEDPKRKEFARAYLFYKLVFLIAGLVVLLILIWIGLGLLDQLLAYMEML